MRQKMLNEIIEHIKKYTDKNVDVDSLDINKVITYLKTYQYIKENFNLADFVQAVIRFQKTFGLANQDGVVSPNTIRAMEYSRCGCPDTLEEANVLDKWAFTHIKYYIDAFPPGLTKEEVRAIYKKSYDSCSAVCGLTFEEVFNSNQANLVLTTGNKNGLGSPSGVLAYAYLPSGPNHTQQLTATFDIAEVWVYDSKKRGIYLQNVHCHECCGHNMGLSHSNVSTALMAPFYSETIAVPQQNDDIPRLVARYGKPKTPAPTPQIPVNPPQTPSDNSNSIVITYTGKIDSVSIPGFRTTKLSE